MKKLILSVVVASAFLTSCSNVDFGTTNENGNGTQSSDMGALLAGAILDFSTNTGSYIAEPTLYAQYQSQVVYTTESRYSESPRDWSEYYAKDLNNLNEILKFLEVPSNISPYVLSQGMVENQKGVAKIFKSIVIKRVTDTWGDVPYSEALQGLDNPSPKFDRQEDVYKAIIADLKAGRDLLIGNSDPNLVGDVLYKRDLSKWRKLANSMIMASCIQLSKKYPNASDYPAIEFNNALNDAAGSIVVPEDEAWFAYDSQNNFRNPFSQFRSEDYRLAQEFTDALRGRGAYRRTSNHVLDTRVTVYATKTERALAGFFYTGLPYGYSQKSLGELNIATATTVRTQMAGRFTDKDASLPFFVSSYNLLNRAEAAALGWTTEDPTSLLSQAIDASYISLNTKFNNPSTLGDGLAYRNARVIDAGVSPEMLLQVIREEKWVALFPSGFEAWNEFRRTGVPALLPATDYLNNGVIPGRYNYPQTTKILNTVNYNSGVSTLLPASDNNSSKVWWAQ